MKFVKVIPADAERLKKYIMEKGLYDKSHKFLKEEGSVFFPLKEGGDGGGIAERFPGVEIVERTSEKIERALPLKEVLKGRLSAEEIDHLKTAHDVVGSIAIIEIPPELEKHEMLIAETLLDSHKNIKTVVKKCGGHEGVFRVQSMEHLAGEPTKETVHKEQGVRLKLDVEKVYFSARLSTERKRIMQLVRPGEKVLVMFSGCAPYPCVISKNTDASEVVGIEMNPYGHKYGVDNVELNKLGNVTLYLGDVRKVVPKLKGKFDRIVMPLPHTAEEFLDTAFLVSKKGTVIHMYDFLDDEDIPDKVLEKVDVACRREGKKYRILGVRKCGQFSPYTFRVCVDFVLG